MAAEPAGSLRRLVDFNVGGSAEEAEAGAAAMVEALKEAEVEATRLGTAAWFVGWDEMVETVVAPLCARLAHVSSHATSAAAAAPPPPPPRRRLTPRSRRAAARRRQDRWERRRRGDADDDADADAKDDGKKDERRQRLVKYLGGCAEEVAACVGDCVRSLRALAFLPEKEGGGTSAAAVERRAHGVRRRRGGGGGGGGAGGRVARRAERRDPRAVGRIAEARQRGGAVVRGRRPRSPRPRAAAAAPHRAAAEGGAAAVPHPEWLAAYQSLRNATLAVQQLVLAEKSPPTGKDGAAAPLDGAWAALEPLLRRGGAVGGGQAAVAPLARALAAAYPQCAEGDAKLLRSLLGCHRLFFIGAAADAPPPKGKDDGYGRPRVLRARCSSQAPTPRR